MYRLLLVEDDDGFREALSGQLKKLKYEVTEAANGRVARGLCTLQDFDLIICDMQMPFLSGLELLVWVMIKKSTPFILMTGFTHIIETKKAFEMGATDFIAKPFKHADLQKAIEAILVPPKTEEAAPPPKPLDEQYCKISIDEFVSKPQIEFDVYVRLSDKKYVKIGYSGDQIPTDRINSYKEKGVRHLHIRREDFSKLVDFNLSLSKLVTESDSINKEKKFNFLKYTGEVILERAFIEGVNQEAYDDAKDMLQNSIEVIAQNDGYFNLLSMLNQHADWLHAHCVGTSMVAIMIARKLGHTTSQVFFKLGMAGMFHEIGCKEIPRELLEKPRPLLSQSERTLLETHPARGREILTEVKGVPSDVIDMVYQHHEDMVGTGYPLRIKKTKIHPLAKILQVADVFCDVAIAGAHHSATDAANAIQYIESFYREKLDKEALLALKSIYPSSMKKAV